MNFGLFKPTDIAGYCCCPVAKTPGSHPVGPCSIPETEPNWPSQHLARMLDVTFLDTFCWSQYPWPTKSMACISSNCLFEMLSSSFFLCAPQIYVDFLLIVCCNIEDKRILDIWLVIASNIYFGNPWVVYLMYHCWYSRWDSIHNNASWHLHIVLPYPNLVGRSFLHHGISQTKGKQSYFHLWKQNNIS